MEVVGQFFSTIWGIINEFFASTLNLEQFLGGLYNEFIFPIPDFLKTLLLVFALVIFVFGLIAFIKKLFKLFVVLAIIAIIIILLRNR